ncbi:kinase-like protein [Rickenella mellea]|uniref:Kinase-like protein n=1 Tax=Rickenella mellea TaxID=50990 RepID=A0A4Y7PQ75_9AGAM|nr:kinase-like protein [Rickenella mellea]
MKQSSDDWISSWQANCKNLTTFLAFTTPMSISSKSECLAMTRAVAIYPHLIAYIFVHLTMYSSNLQPLTKLWEMGAGCRHWDDHTCLLKYHTVLECLWNLLQENDRDLSIPGCNLRHLLALDMDILRNKVENVLQDKKSKEQLLELCASDPVPLSNLLQTLLDAQNETADFKRLVVRMLARIAKKSGCYPDSLVLQGIQTKGTRPVAGGGFADVWKGSMPNGNEVVALKAFRVYTQSVRRKILQRFSHEAVIWRQLRHPNILPFYGVHAGGDESGGDEFGELSLVSPWMDTGNILNYVDANPQADRISLLADVTQGLKYLHLFEPTVVHGDIKAANVLITPSLNACLADFGLASLRDSQESTWDTTTEKAAGTLRWQAPELLLGDENGETVLPNRCSDIYSFGCLCIEVFTGKAPFAEILRDTVVVMSIMQKRTPKRPSDDLSEIGLDESMWNMMEQCWQSEPTHRPTIVQVEEYFNGRNGDGRRPPVVRDDLPAGVRSTLGQYGFSDAYLDEVSNREDCSASVDPVARVPETRDISNPDSRIQSANSIIHDIALTDLTTLRRLYADGTISPSVSLYSAVESYSNRISLFMGDITRLQVDVIVTNHFLVDRKAIFVGYNTRELSSMMAQMWR